MCRCYGVPTNRIKTKNLSPLEWDKVAEWWADRFEGGTECLTEFKDHRDT